jgi:hypothetical protein
MGISLLIPRIIFLFSYSFFACFVEINPFPIQIHTNTRALRGIYIPVFIYGVGTFG